jgi:hypothetical protein
MRGLNHAYPSSPQYNVSEMTAPVDTVARPNITRTTEGRQHIDAMSVELAIIFQSDRSGLSLVVAYASLMLLNLYLCF